MWQSGETLSEREPSIGRTTPSPREWKPAPRTRMAVPRNRSLTARKFLAPLVCLALLGAAWGERERRLKPSDVAEYHQRARLAVEGVRYRLGVWSGSDVEVPAAAQKLLRPNALLSRVYVDHSVGRAAVEVSLLIIQCGDPRDMQGHYPPNCYPAHGATLTEARPLELAAGGTRLRCTEYRFRSPAGAGGASGGAGTVVLNSLIIPGHGSTPEMKGVYAAAQDYQMRLFGAAQVQIVIPDVVSVDRREQIYRELLGGCEPTLRELMNTGLPGKRPSETNPSKDNNQARR